METNTKSEGYQITQTIIRFPDITLRTRDAHKLRGFFGNLFKEHSPLLHNHFGDGSLRYAYPLVQYKVVHKTPILIGLAEGSELLIDLFLKIKEINIDNQKYTILSKNIENRRINITETSDLLSYSFATLWMALNEKNYQTYLKEKTGRDKLLKKILTGNILSFYKGIGFYAEKEILLTTELKERKTRFKNMEMIAFEGSFICNAILPDYIGLGKSVSRGFGTILKQ